MMTSSRLLTTSSLSASVARGVATVTLNRPDRLNALNDALIRDVRSTVEQLASSDPVRVLVLTGAGRAFSAGGDLADVEALAMLDPEEQEQIILGKAQSTAELLNLPVLTIAAINGVCAGAAIGWAAACDLRFAADTATLRTAYAGRGLSGDFGVARLLRQHVGAGTALDWLARPREISAAEAREAGFFHAVYPADSFSHTVAERAAAYASIAPAALAGVLANVREDPAGDFGEYLVRETRRHVHSKVSAVAAHHPTNN